MKHQPISSISDNKLTGFFAAGAVVCIWSTWIVVSRAGAISNLSVFDMTAMRFGISSVIVFPYVLYRKPWKTLNLHKIIFLTFVLGPFYILAVFVGFNYAPASHGAVFMNGLLPAMSLISGIFIFKNKPKLLQVIGSIIILISIAALSFSSKDLNFSLTWKGDILFFIGGIFFTAYVVANRAWRISLAEFFLCSSVINGIVFIPIWYFLLPSGLHLASLNQIFLQSFYQGIVPPLIGLVLVAHAVRRIGSDATSSIMAAVPGLAALLGSIFLNEILNLNSWISIFGLTVGIAATSWSGKLKF
ncbi:MAG: drug/metabolite transporter (DMT)-like permease [Paracoccaceae bacterium]|jgi:drug/metabolite transporter (DMT)-like permease